MKTTDVIIDWFRISSKDLSGQDERVIFVSSKDRLAWASRARMSPGIGSYGGYFVLCDELHEWFMEISPNYCLRVTIGKQWVENASKNMAGQPIDRCAFVLQFLDPQAVYDVQAQVGLMLARFYLSELTIIKVPKGTDIVACTKWLNEKHRWHGSHYDDWGHTLEGHRNFAFYPGQENIAMLFKLTWGGQ